MHHPSARIAIDSILASAGFGERALALTTAAQLSGDSPRVVRLRQNALQRAALMPSDPIGRFSPPLLGEVPDDDRILSHQLCPLLIGHAQNLGLHAACLMALRRLWPHASTSERPLLRQHFVASLLSAQAPADSYLTQAQMRAWQRDMPTLGNDATVGLSSLVQVMSAADARAAYLCLAEHLGICPDIARLCRALGALTAQMRARYHDPDRQVMHVLLGTVACEQLAGTAMPEHLTTMVAQIGHQMWWCRQRAGLQPVPALPAGEPGRRPLAEALASGDLGAIQRAARAASQQPQEFWPPIWSLLEERINSMQPGWPCTLSLVGALRWRSTDAAISPDDAAALGSALADLVCGDRNMPVLASL